MIPNDQLNNNVSSSGIQLFANFDSGNMLRYERVTAAMASSQVQPNSNETEGNTINPNNGNVEGAPTTMSHPLPKHDVEFNVWTRRDCEGTPKVNGNRSWFYFGVRGGYGKCIRFNMMNLNRQARLFEMGMLPVFRTVPGHEKWARIYIRPCWEVVNEDFKMSFIHRMSDLKSSVTYFAFCFPHSYEDMQNLLNNYDTFYNSQLADHYLEQNILPVNIGDIYYHRETLCHSIDGNKVDLLTITSYKGITKDREHHFDKRLFPDAPTTKKRPHQFRNKRVYFLSSRVHPGETPAAFVFLGFLDFILRPDDYRAKILRDTFVFKMIPILNPDGVQRGHYRTDQFGVNLNRMYLDPDFEKHPSIYAAKSLIAYHHINNSMCSRLPITIYDVFKDMMPPEQAIPIIQENEALSNERPIQGSKTSNERTFPPNHQIETSANNSRRPSHHAFDEVLLEDRQTPDENRPFFIERKENGLVSKFVPNVTTNEEIESASPYSFHYYNENLEMHGDSFPINQNDDEDEGNLRNQIRGNEGSDDDDDALSTTNNDNGVQEAKSPHLSNPDFLKISPHESGIAVYMDLHGHASKKGCFIYGNHLPDDDQHTDNLLFAKLISLNSPHFDYENCNFTVKNMYMKDKREGLSKEGSGRVALNKHFGILHSYTLECSYAVGKSCNPIPPAENEAHGGRISPPTPFSLPPKFLIEHYRDVGKACVLSAIDILPGKNPFTRVSQSTFKTLQTLRDFLKHQIRQQRNRIGNTRAQPSTSSTNTTNSTRLRQQQSQQYMARLTQTYRTTGSSNILSAVGQHQQHIISSFPVASSAPAAPTPSRSSSYVQQNRVSSNATANSRPRPSYDNRRYSNLAAAQKRGSQTTLTSNARSVPVLSRLEMSSMPQQSLTGIQHQMSSPGRLQRLQQQTAASQFVIPTASLLDPTTIARTRAGQLPQGNIRGAIHRNAVSFNGLATNSPATTVNRGRSQNSAPKRSATRTARLRQQSLNNADIQQSTANPPTPKVIYRTVSNHDPPPVFFE